MSASLPPAVSVWFLRRDYAAHCRLDPEMRKTFQQWQKLAQSMEDQARAQGLVVHRVVVDPHELAAWAKREGRRIHADSRQEFAILRFAQDNARAGHA